MRERDLDDLLAEARLAAPVPSAQLLARVLADAEAARPEREAPVRRARRPWTVMLFGSGLAAGLVSATAAGIWIGVVQPAPVAAALWQAQASEDLESLDLAPGYDVFASLDLPVEG